MSDGLEHEVPHHDDEAIDREVEYFMMMHLLAWRIASRSRAGRRSKLFY